MSARLERRHPALGFIARVDNPSLRHQFPAAADMFAPARGRCGGGFRGGRGDGGGRVDGRSGTKRGGGGGVVVEPHSKAVVEPHSKAVVEPHSKVVVEPHINVVVEPHFHRGVFLAKGKDAKNLLPDVALYNEKRMTVKNVTCTKNLVPGEALYNDKRISVQNENGTKIDYRVWDPSLSELAAAILVGIDNIWIEPGVHVLYLGAASETTVSHVSDIVGPEGKVYAVDSSHGRDLLHMAEKHTNVSAIIEDARHPEKYETLVGMVDVIFSAVAQPDQVQILALNARYLKPGGHFVISVEANCIDSTVPAEDVFWEEVMQLRAEHFKPVELVTLEPFRRNHAFIGGVYPVPKKRKADA